MRNKWTYDSCKEFALKCTTRNQFKQNYFYAWRAMHYYKWVDDLTKHMEVVGNTKKRCVYVYMFPENKVYIGLTYNINKRHNSHKNKGVLKNYITNNIYPSMISEGYIEIEDAMKLEQQTIEKYKKDGFVVLNTMKGGQVGTTKLLDYSIEEILKVSEQYQSRWEFQQKDSKIYDYAKRYKLLDKVCSHMFVLKKTFDLDEIVNEIKSCVSYTEFTQKYPSSYQKLANHKKLFVLELYHTKKNKSLSNDEIIEIGKKYKTKGEWIDSNERSKYETARSRKLLDIIFS